MVIQLSSLSSSWRFHHLYYLLMLKTIAIYAVDVHKGGKTIAIAAAIVQQRANDAADKKSLMSADNTTKKTENYLENTLKNGYPGMIKQRNQGVQPFPSYGAIRSRLLPSSSSSSTKQSFQPYPTEYNYNHIASPYSSAFDMNSAVIESLYGSGASAYSPWPGIVIISGGGTSNIPKTNIYSIVGGIGGQSSIRPMSMHSFVNNGQQKIVDSINYGSGGQATILPTGNNYGFGGIYNGLTGNSGMDSYGSDGSNSFGGIINSNVNTGPYIGGGSGPTNTMDMTSYLLGISNAARNKNNNYAGNYNNNNGMTPNVYGNNNNNIGGGTNSWIGDNIGAEISSNYGSGYLNGYAGGVFGSVDNSNNNYGFGGGGNNGFSSTSYGSYGGRGGGGGVDQMPYNNNMGMNGYGSGIISGLGTPNSGNNNFGSNTNYNNNNMGMNNYGSGIINGLGTPNVGGNNFGINANYNNNNNMGINGYGSGIINGLGTPNVGGNNFGSNINYGNGNNMGINGYGGSNGFGNSGFELNGGYYGSGSNGYGGSLLPTNGDMIGNYGGQSTTNKIPISGSIGNGGYVSKFVNNGFSGNNNGFPGSNTNYETDQGC